MIIIAQAKKMGLSLFELNEFRVQDFLDYAYAYRGKTDGKKWATQEDIDRFFG